MKVWWANFRVAAVAAVAAIIVAAAISGHPVHNLKFRLGLHDESAMKNGIEQALRQFNRDFATFFNAGGPTSILGTFPADNLIKRRIFQEIQYWDQKNIVIVYDKDAFKIEKITLSGPDRAVAIANEIWYISAQKADTRQPISTLKRSPERIRYFLKLVRGQWRVTEYEVYGETDSIPAEVKP